MFPIHMPTIDMKDVRLFAPSPLIKVISTVLIEPVLHPVVVCDHVLMDDVRKKKMAVFTGHCFERFSKGGILVASLPGKILCCCHLLMKTSDSPLINEIGGQDDALTSMEEIIFQIVRYEEGVKSLDDTGRANIFYLLDRYGSFCVVFVHRIPSEGRNQKGIWVIDARDCGAREWLEGYWLFFHAPELLPPPQFVERIPLAA